MDQGNWKRALTKTRRVAFGRLATILGTTEITPDLWDDLEEILILGDVGIHATSQILSELGQIVRHEGITSGSELQNELHDLLRSWFLAPEESLQGNPHVILLVGVNGSGKTTTAAKLAFLRQQQGDKAIFAAADTYRAAATEQLRMWGQRLDIEVVSGAPGSDPGAVVYSASQAALSRGIDTIIVDTSGRMHTNQNLMAELEKICRVAGKVIPDAPHEALLVLDATSGQNGLQQAKTFAEAIELSGVVLAKMDTSARGGIALSIASQLELPIRYVGIGENLEDMLLFSPDAYLEGLLAEQAEFRDLSYE